MATTALQNYTFTPPHSTPLRRTSLTLPPPRLLTSRALPPPLIRRFTRTPTWTCKAAEVSVTEGPSASGGGGAPENWIPVVPITALPKGERRVIIQDGETILLLWYKDEVFAIENRSPAEGAYSEGLINAKLTQVVLDFLIMLVLIEL